MSETPAPNPEEAQPAAKPRWGSGWAISAIFHLALVGLLIWAPFQLWNSSQKPVQTAAASNDGSQDNTAGPEQKSAPKKTIAERLDPEQVQQAVQQKIKEQQDLPPEKRQQVLEENAKRFERMSNEESVDQMAKKFQDWMKTPPRATKPADNPPPGRFNHKTAQMYDLTRAKNDQGKWEYSCVLLDAEGRTMTIPPEHFDQQLGKDLYPTFEVMKENPLTRQVYEQIVMGLFDEMLKEEESNAAEGKSSQASVIAD